MPRGLNDEGGPTVSLCVVLLIQTWCRYTGANLIGKHQLTSSLQGGPRYSLALAILAYLLKSWR